MNYQQLDLFSTSTQKEIKNLRRWIGRLEKRVCEMEFRQQLVEHAKKTGFEAPTKRVQLDMFGT